MALFSKSISMVRVNVKIKQGVANIMNGIVRNVCDILRKILNLKIVP